jgi:hypothetical protein
MSNIENNAQPQISSSTQDMMTSILKSIQSHIPAEEGKKITMKDLIDKVVFDTKIKISTANGLVPELVRNYPGVKVEAGRSGGVYRGGKPVRVDRRERCETCNQVVRQKEIKQ